MSFTHNNSLNITCFNCYLPPFLRKLGYQKTITMKINEIRITGIGGISDLILQFDPRMNIICGPNGIGKTTILEAIAHCFIAGEVTILKRNVNCQSGSIHVKLDCDPTEEDVEINVNEFEPNKGVQINGRHKLAKYILSLKTTRTFAYQPLDQINKDVEKQMHILWSDTKNGVSLVDIKNWFVNRYLYSKHDGALTPEQVTNFELAKKCFSALNPEFSFSKVDASTNEIIVFSPNGEIYYEYLSSGFKSCLSILFGIIKEIEYRFKGDEQRAECFSGVVLIDEIDLHLHPEWQSKIQKVLTETFKATQFITCTHSPHVVQSAEANQIIALENSDSGVVCRKLPESKYGFKGWTIDEVLIEVMGMQETRSTDFLNLVRQFGAAIDAEDLEGAKKLFVELDSSLNPNNVARKLFTIQFNALQEYKNDKA